MDKLTLTNVKQYGKKSGIYHIIISGTSHHYVGSAKDLRKRLNAHRTALIRGKHENFRLQKCYNDYKLISFEFEILEFCDAKDLLSRESYFIKKLNPDLNIVLDPVELNRDEEFKKRVSKAKKNYYQTHRPVNIIKVYQYDKSGKFLNKYDSATDAAIAVGGQTNGIIAVCNGRAKTHKGFQWSKRKVYKMNSLIKEKPKKEKKVYKNPNAKTIYQYDLNGTFIKEWESASLAGKTLNIDKRTIAFAANENYPIYKSAGGYQWSYIYLDSMKEYENHSKDSKAVPIYVLDILEQKEYYFNRIADAVRTLLPNTKNFDSSCASISSSAKNKCLFAHRYLARYSGKYKLGDSNVVIDLNTNIIYKNLKSVPQGIVVNKLIDCAREKFRESEKNQEFPWSTLIEDL